MLRRTLTSGEHPLPRAVGLIAVGIGATLLLQFVLGRGVFDDGPPRTAPDIVRAIHAVEGDTFCTQVSSGEDYSVRSEFAGPKYSGDGSWRAACFVHSFRTGETTTYISCVVVKGRTLEVETGELRKAQEGENTRDFDC